MGNFCACFSVYLEQLLGTHIAVLRWTLGVGMLSVRDIKDVLTDWKKILTVLFNILATLPVSAFGTFLPKPFATFAKD